MRVAHQKYKDDDLKEVSLKGHVHGIGTITYRKVDGVWKFGGIEPGVRWFEYDFDKLFHAEAEPEDNGQTQTQTQTQSQDT